MSSTGGEPDGAAASAPPKRPRETPPSLSIPNDWKIELPERGSSGPAEVGTCRSIEAGYVRQGVLGQGTYGEVFRALDRATGDVVAAKKIKMENEKEGFPITAVREIKILSRLARSRDLFEGIPLRDNVVALREVVRSDGARGNARRGSVYMIFEYADHDMTGLLDRQAREGPRFTEPQVKGYLRQLFVGLSLLFKERVLHRDLKNSNLLVSADGVLKIADFGLARFCRGGPGGSGNPGGGPGGPGAPGGGGGGGGGGGADPGTSGDPGGLGPRMTNRVITLWYRPPELFLGSERYGPEVDAWSAGCIAFELITGKPLFAAQDETGMVERIFSVLGRATEQTMPGCTAYPNHAVVNWARFPAAGRLANHLRSRGVRSESALSLLCSLLCLDPAARSTPGRAAMHEWFKQPPFPLRPEQMPRYESSHEMGMKRARKQGPAAAGPAARGPPPPAPPRGGLPATGGGSGWQALRR